MFPVCGVQVVLLCRDPCLTMGGLKDLDWDLAQWMPLITDKAFVPWLVAVRAPGPHTACVHPTAYLHNVVPSKRRARGCAHPVLFVVPA